MGRMLACSLALGTLADVATAALPGRPADEPIIDRHGAAAMLPARVLDCTLRRIVNFDPSKNQQPGDYVFTERHPFRLFLPAIPVRTSAPPQSTQPAEPVDPATRILADPDAIAPDGKAGFDRVVDYWPERVEMTASINKMAVNLIIIDRIDVRTRQANLFLTRANDAVTYDLAHLYAGRCSVSLNM